MSIKKKLHFFLIIICWAIHFSISGQDIKFLNIPVKKIRELNVSKIRKNNGTYYSIDHNKKYTCISYSKEYKEYFYGYVKNDSITNILIELPEIKVIYYSDYYFNSNNKVDSIFHYSYYTNLDLYDTTKVSYISHYSQVAKVRELSYWNSKKTPFIKHKEYFLTNNRLDSLLEYSNHINGMFGNNGRLDTLRLQSHWKFRYDEKGRLIKTFLSSYKSKPHKTYSYQDNKMKIVGREHLLTSGCVIRDKTLFFKEEIYEFDKNGLIKSITFITRRNKKKNNSKWRIKDKYKFKYKYEYK